MLELEFRDRYFPGGAGVVAFIRDDAVAWRLSAAQARLISHINHRHRSRLT